MPRRRGTPKTGGRDFKSGAEWTGNAKGLKKLTLDEKKIRVLKRLTAPEFVEMTSMLLNATDCEIAVILSDPEAPKFKRIVAKALNRADIDGDFHQLNQILDRCWGRVKDQPPGGDGEKNSPAVLEEIRKILNDPTYERKA